MLLDSQRADSIEVAGNVKTVKARHEGIEKTLLPPNRNKLKGFACFHNEVSDVVSYLKSGFLALTQLHNTAWGSYQRRRRKKVTEKTGRKVFCTSEIRATYCKAT